jgi:hypothetical protein
MRAREFITDHKDQKLDEFLPVIAAAGGALARGAAMGAGALARGASAAGGALARGAANIGGKIIQGAEQLGAKAVQGAGQLGTKAVQGAQQIGNKAVQQVGNKIAQSAQSAVKQMATGSIGSSGSSTSSSPSPTANKSAPVSIPQGVTIEPAPASATDKPNELKFNIGGATFSLDTSDPKNAQAVQQLKQQMGAK